MALLFHRSPDPHPAPLRRTSCLLAPELIPAPGAIFNKLAQGALFLTLKKKGNGGFMSPGIPYSGESLTTFDNAGRPGLFQKERT